jgi:hypothetical protein
VPLEWGLRRADKAGDDGAHARLRGRKFV